MREIKFRAWDKQHKGMVTWEQALRNFKMDEFFTPMDDFALMQNTGLKDKNGVEIYEGDIIDYKDLTVFDGDRTEQVHFENGRFMFGTLNCSRPELWEVIGNIYENPELLKESNHDTK